jgi:predicted nucleotidyltransferase
MAFSETMETAARGAAEVYEKFRALPLDEKGRFIGNCASWFVAPGLLTKGARCLCALPKVQAGMVAIGRMATRESELLAKFAQSTALGASLAEKVDNAQLVTFGGKLMTQELAQALEFVHAKIGGTVPVRDFVGFVEKTQTPIVYCFKKTFKEFEKIAAAHTDPRMESLLKIPQLIEETRFNKVVKLIKENEIIKQIGGEIYVHGSRAKGTAKIYSDIDIGIRVSAERFGQLVQECFPNAANSRLRTMNHAMEVGKIQRGELKLSKLGEQIHKLLGIKVDISVIRAGGPFDYGPFISI